MTLNRCLNIRFYGRDSGVPLVFLHGFMGSAASFDILADLLPHTVRPVGIDLPGHGQSRFDRLACLMDPGSFMDVAGMIVSDLESAGIDRFFLYGYSMGGRVAQAVSLFAPEKIRCLMTESAGFGIAGPKERRARYAADCRLLEGVSGPDDFDAFLDRWHALPLFRTLPSELKGSLKAAKKNNVVSELARALEVLSVGNQPYFLPALVDAPFPVALFCGAADEKYRNIAEDAAKNIPGARLFVFPDASHDIHVQYPVDVAETIKTVLAAL